MDLPEFLEIIKRGAFFNERYGSMNLSEEQIKAMIGKEFKGYNIKKIGE